MMLRPLILAAVLGFVPTIGAETPGPAAFTAKELAQGYRDVTLMAKPRADHLATIDAEERAEGMTIDRKFDRFGGLRVIVVPRDETVDAALARLRASGRYEFVDRDYIKHLVATPNDPSFASQWGLNNPGNNPNVPGPGVAGADIHAVAAWDIRHDATYTTASGSPATVIVATVDTGLLLTHTDIAANLWVNPEVNADGYVNDLHGINATVGPTNPASGNPTDNDGHGTHVAGIIGAVGNNGVGISGVAWKVQLMPLKFLTASGSGVTSNEVTCLDFALAHGANIVNGSFASSTPDPSELSALQALDRAGIIFVAAAGNSAEDNDLTLGYPASYPVETLVAAAASDNRDDIVFFSSFGSGNVDLFAPGSNILSLFNTSDTATTVLSGTSMAAPFVSGSLALLKAQCPSDTARQLINRLLRHVDTGPNFTGRAQTGGRLNLAASLASAPGDNTPFNDRFANRGHLAGPSLAVRSSNTGATLEPGEPLIAATAGGASLWWDWTAPVSGLVTLTTSGSSYPTLLAVYTGTSVSTLVTIANSVVPGPGGSAVSFQAQAGVTYNFTVDGQNGANGLTLLNLNYGNDLFSGASQLNGLSAGITSTNRSATREAGEPLIRGNPGGHSVWYTWTAPKNGQFQVAAFSYAFDPLLAVYTGPTVGTLSLAASAAGPAINSAANAPASICLCTFTATAGTAYRITVDGTTDSGTGLNAGQYTLTIADSLWQGSTGDTLTSSPAVGPDGTVYIGGDDGIFYAFNADGSSKWTYDTSSPTSVGSFDTTAAAIGGDGTVYAAANVGDTATGAIQGTVYAFNPNGTVKWTYMIQEPSDPTLSSALASPPALASVVTADDTLYLKAQDNNIYSLNTATGTLKWTYPVPGVSYAAPSVAPDGTVYLGSDNSTLYALASNGSLRWTFPAASAIYNGAAIDAAGNLYFGTLGGTFYALNSAGKQLWAFAANNSISSSPALGANGAVYFGSYDHHLYALNAASGGLLWAALLGSEVRASSPAIDANGVVYVGCYDNNLYAVNANGSLNRIFATGDWIRSSPVIAGTTLYFGSSDHKLYAFSLGVGSTPSTWPMYLASPRRLGRTSLNFAPSFTTQPVGRTIASGSTVVLTAAAGATPAATYQWQLNGSNLPGATSPRLVITGAGAANAGTYVCVATNSLGSSLSGAAVLSVISTANPGRLTNLSVNATAGKSQVLTVGFVTGGAGTNGTQSLLVRATGPALAPFGVAGFLPDPNLALLSGSTTVIANDNWASTAANQAAVTAADNATGAFGLPNSSSLDAALVDALPAGGYTAQVSGNTTATGTTLAEVYDNTPPGAYTPATPRLINLSSNSQIAANGAMTAGFVINGSTAKTVLIRATGPALAAFGVPGAMPDPQLTLHAPVNGQDTVLASNAGWGGDAQIAAASAAVGAFPLTNPASRDSVVLVTLAPGSYTVVASSVSGASGVALIEVYEVP